MFNFLDFSKLKLALHVGVGPLVLAIAFTSHINANLLKRSAQSGVFIRAFKPVIRSCLFFLFFHESHKPSKLVVRFIALGVISSLSTDSWGLSACYDLATLHGLSVRVSPYRHIESFHFLFCKLYSTVRRFYSTYYIELLKNY